MNNRQIESPPNLQREQHIPSDLVRQQNEQELQLQLLAQFLQWIEQQRQQQQKYQQQQMYQQQQYQQQQYQQQQQQQMYQQQQYQQQQQLAAPYCTVLQVRTVVNNPPAPFYINAAPYCTSAVPYCIPAAPYYNPAFVSRYS